MEPVSRVIPAMKVPAVLVLLAVVATAVAQLVDRGWWPESVTQGSEFATTRSTRPPRPPTPATPATPVPTSAPAQSQENCDCPTPPQFQPVCGTNNQTYTNPQKLDCARRCGIAGLSIQYLGTCQNGR